ncbi:MAG TPA: transporter [Caulobacteraceae bacterium]|nr:transporter [Caulobacteraceae bacterium]
MKRAIIGALILGGLSGANAWADDASAPAPDKSGYTLFNPTPDDKLRSFCADRPTKSNGACTVDAGHWQIESDIYNFTQQSFGGVTQTTQLITNPTLKLGVTNTLDIEVNIAPYEIVTTHDAATGLTTQAEGAGDLYLRTKWNLVGDDGGNVAFALFPFVKIPTAGRVIGNGEVEGGLNSPLTINLPNDFQLSIDPEADALADAEGAGRHLNLSSTLSLGYALTKTVTVFGELWGDENFDPSGRVFQSSADIAAAWIPAKTPTLQFDGGFNFGLNSSTPGVQGYVGISHRF